ncbi:MAG: hypothetical protein ACRDPY_08685 [Streptosporangiaceae bacterium]
MKLNSLATATAAVAIVSGLGLTHHGAAAALHTAHSHSHRPAAAVTQAAPAADAAVTWLESTGGQAQVTFNNDVSTLLQPGPGYGTTPQDYTAWYAALHASNITVA